MTDNTLHVPQPARQLSGGRSALLLPSVLQPTSATFGTSGMVGWQATHGHSARAHCHAGFTCFALTVRLPVCQVRGRCRLKSVMCGFKQDSGLLVRRTISGCTVWLQAVKREADKAWACVQAECQSLLAELLAAPSLRTFTRAAARPGDDPVAGGMMHAHEQARVL